MDNFDIPVTYKGQEYNFKSQLLVLGHTYKIKVNVKGQEIFFEPDEERNYRASIDPETATVGKGIDVELLQAIAEAIEGIVK